MALVCRAGRLSFINLGSSGNKYIHLTSRAYCRRNYRFERRSATYVLDATPCNSRRLGMAFRQYACNRIY